MHVVVSRPPFQRRAARYPAYKKTRKCVKLERAYKKMKDAGLRRAENNHPTPPGSTVFIGNVCFIHEKVKRADDRYDHYYHYGLYRFNSRPKALRFAQALNSFSQLEVYLKAHELGLFDMDDSYSMMRSRIHMGIEKTLDDIAIRYGTTLAEMRARGHLGDLHVA